MKYAACVFQLLAISGLYQVPGYLPGVHAQSKVILHKSLLSKLSVSLVIPLDQTNGKQVLHFFV